MVDVPADIRPELAERFRQLRPFDEAEVSLVQALVRRPDRLTRAHEMILRQALNLARLWVVSGRGGEVVVGPQLSAFRDSVRPLTETLARNPDIDPLSLGSDAEALSSLVKRTRAELQTAHLGRLSPAEIDRELFEKALVLGVGGGGGCGYVHLGAFSVLESLRLVPRLVTGASIGSILGLFRAREIHFRDATVRAVTHGLHFKKIFRVLEGDTRYGMPGALRLYLRSTLSRFFVNDGGEPMRLGELPVPFLCIVTGVRRDAARGASHYEKVFLNEIRRGALGTLLHLRDLTGNMMSFLTEMVRTPGALKSIALGGDDETRDFDVLDAVGFSSALPAVIQYDITRDDPRMHEIMKRVLSTHNVDYLADGGLSANVPVRSAWEYVQAGRLGTRNAFVLGLDCFAPQMGRNVLFLPLQRLAAENVVRDRAFAQVMFTYRRTLAPTALVPKQHAVETAIRYGKEEFSRHGPFLQKMLEPLSPA